MLNVPATPCLLHGQAPKSRHRRRKNTLMSPRSSHDRKFAQGRQGVLGFQRRPFDWEGRPQADIADPDQGHKVAASKDNPEYLVESDKSGKRAAHKPSALKKA
ncbi:DUF2945 domain-containing protein [Sphingomonas rhizophila]|uniref:DUF2945 domain-containing protein n=1 Tax=Sphingomonas rhizophila TaxID=2071607 RepID=UPI001FE61BE4|nr:DUF2945 domain-containing protein [Sphingomonas rhizophila]